MQRKNKDRFRIPEIWLTHSLPLIEHLIPDFSFDDYSKLRKKAKHFQNLVQKFGKNILKEISVLSGVPWRVNEIPIYIVPEQALARSFSHPLVLIWRQSSTDRLRLFVLVHELTHINLLGDYKSLFLPKTGQWLEIGKGEKQEAVCWLIAKIAIKNLVSNWSSYEMEWQKILDWDKSGLLRQLIEDWEKGWDWEKINLLAYIKLNRETSMN